MLGLRLTNFVKQVPVSRKLHQHIETGEVFGMIVPDHQRVHIPQDVLVAERFVNLHFLLESLEVYGRFSIL